MPLTEDDVLDAACAILDNFGLADLTMRRLGETLGVRAGAVYHHVPNKQTLLARIADRIVADVPDAAGDWRSGLAGWAAGLRASLLAHRDSADLVASTRAMGLGRRDAAGPAGAVLRGAGLSQADADAAASALLHLVLGHVAEEQARRDWERFGRPAGQTHLSDPASFSLGVSLLLDGIGRRFSLS